jgi:hypothetical protein
MIFGYWLRRGQDWIKVKKNGLHDYLVCENARLF